ncbi:MAG: Xaa-Pro dipeptidase [Shewanella sp.]|nr:Xaa-Pro dipeptidase [Shewanella sp.]
MTQLGLHYQQHINELNHRCAEICQREQLAGLVIHSGQVHRQFLDDMDYPFKVNPHFKAWLPLIDSPNCWLVVDGQSKPKLIFYRPVDFWHKVSDVPVSYWSDCFDIVLLTQVDKVAQLLPQDLSNWAYMGEHLDVATVLGIQHRNPEAVLQYLHFHRSFKTAYELDCLREANRIAVTGHHAAKQAFFDGGSEFDIQLAYLAAIGQSENQAPYSSIIAINENSAILHYMVLSHQKPEQKRSFLIDAGANCNGYASDITRTYSVEQNQFSDVIAAMDKLQLEIINMMRPGVSYVDLHIATHQKLAQLLINFDIATGSVESLVSQGITKAFFPHGLGHMLGIQVHDVAGFFHDERGTHIASPKEHPFLRCTRTLAENQVLTIEPGFYIIDTLLNDLKQDDRGQQLNWNTINHLKPFGGIRIEDDVIIHQDRVENMTRDCGLN